MISVGDLERILTLEQGIIQMQTKGLIQSDTLIQPQPGGNCMNWVLGHLAESQLLMLETLGGFPPVDAKILARYKRDSLPILHEDHEVLPLKTLLKILGQINKAILARLNEVEEVFFNEVVMFGEREVTRGWKVFFLHFHYTYHIGQLELLRQLTGKTEKLI